MSTWQRNNLAATIAVTLLTMGFSFTIPFLPLYLQAIGNLTPEKGAYWAGLASALGGLGSLLSGPAWGLLGDRYGRKPMLVRAAFGGAVGLLMIGFSSSVWQVVAARVFVGIMAGAGPAALALIAAQTPETDLPRALGRFQAMGLAGLALGPVAAFPLIEAWGYRVTFEVTSAVMFVGAIVVVVLIREDRSVMRAGRERSTDSARAAEREHDAGPVRRPGTLGAIVRSPSARRSFGLVALLGLGVPMVQSSVLASFVKTLVGKTSVTRSLGLLFCGIAVVGAIAALLAGRALPRYGTPKVLAFSCLASAALLPPQGLAHSIWHLAPFTLGSAFFYGGVQTATVRLVSSVVSRESSGVGYGLYQSMQTGSAQLAPFIGGTLVRSIGFRGVFPIAGVVLLVAGLIALRLLRSIEEVPPS